MACAHGKVVGTVCIHTVLGFQLAFSDLLQNSLIYHYITLHWLLSTKESMIAMTTACEMLFSATTL